MRMIVFTNWTTLVWGESTIQNAMLLHGTKIQNYETSVQIWSYMHLCQ